MEADFIDCFFGLRYINAPPSSLIEVEPLES